MESAQNHIRSIKIWPPSQNTRQVLVDRIIKNLTTPSILSRKYGLLTKEEAEEDAKQIESAAFTVTNQHFEKEPSGDGGSAVQLYAKESSKLMVEAVKKGPRTKNDQETIPEAITSAYNKAVFDISNGNRAFIDAEEAKEILKPLKEPGNRYTKICFSNRSFGVEAANVAAPILSSLKDQLTEVDLSDFIAGKLEKEALEVMSIFSLALEGCELSYLNLSNNGLGEKGVRAFGALIRSQNNLVELYLMNDGISEEAAKAVCELIPSTKKLKVLHFDNNMMGDEGAVAISGLVKESPVLEDFRSSSTRIDSKGGIALAKALANCTHLKKLNLCDNMFGTKAGVSLSHSISNYANLTELYLSYLNLEDEATIAIANALKNSHSPIEILEMAGNDITSEASPVLASFITSKKDSLTKLNLSENKLKDEGAIVISKALEVEFGRLTIVDLSTNAIRTDGAKKLARAVVGKPGFKLLNINGNFISNEGVEDVIETFNSSPGLLGPLDENNPKEDDGGLASKLKGLEIKRDE